MYICMFRRWAVPAKTHKHRTQPGAYLKDMLLCRLLGPFNFVRGEYGGVLCMLSAPDMSVLAGQAGSMHILAIAFPFRFQPYSSKVYQDSRSRST